MKNDLNHHPRHQEFFIFTTHSKINYIHMNYLQTMTELYSGSILLWSYGSWIYNYLCNQCISSLKLWVWILIRRGVLDTTLCDKVCQWLAAGRWFSLGTLVSSTNKTDCHDITEILLKVVLNTIPPTSNPREYLFTHVPLGSLILTVCEFIDGLLIPASFSANTLNS